MQKVEELHARGLSIDVHWIPAHEGIEGNEAAGQAAKEATGRREGDTRGPRADPPGQLYPLKTTLKTWCRKTVNQRWNLSWSAESKGRATYRHTPIPTKKVLQPLADLSKAESALLIQMRTRRSDSKTSSSTGKSQESRTQGVVVERDEKRSLTFFCAAASTENSGDRNLAASQDKTTSELY